jgi:hypothetical protein
VNTQPVSDTKPNGPVAAVFVAAGIGCFALGVLVVLNEAQILTNAMLDFAKNYGIGSGVGQLSGKVILATLAFLVSWGALGLYWRGKEVNFGRALTAALVLVALGFLLTFPPVFEIFAKK